MRTPDRPFFLWSLRAAMFTGIAGCAWWACRPLPVFHDELAVVAVGIEPIAGPPAVQAAALDIDAFRTPLWVAPPAPPPPPAPPAEPHPPSPLRLQLLSLVRDQDGSFRALLYDPDADRLLFVAPGDALGEHRSVRGVSAAGVEILDQHGVRTLALSNAAQDAGAGAAPAAPDGGSL